MKKKIIILDGKKKFLKKYIFIKLIISTQIFAILDFFFYLFNEITLIKINNWKFTRRLERKYFYLEEIIILA